MARLSRIVVPDAPHHVTQRGNRRERIFFHDSDYALYRDLLAESCRRSGVVVWAYCLMPNHVHAIMVPSTPDGLAHALGETHRRYAGFINARRRSTGHVFQGRFGSVAMDEAHTLAAVRYVMLNPVKANLVRRAQDWAWSSARAHLDGRDDGLVSVAPLRELIEDFTTFMDADNDPKTLAALRKGSSVGRPLMDDERLRELERELGRPVLPRKRGRKPSRDRAASRNLGN